MTSAGHRGDPAFAENLLESLAMLKKEKNLPQGKGRERISWRNPCCYCILSVTTAGCISKSPAAQKNISSIPGRQAAFSGNLILRSTTEDGERRRRDGVLASLSPAARCDSSQLSGPPSTGEDVFLALAAGPRRTSQIAGSSWGCPNDAEGERHQSDLKKITPVSQGKKGKRQLNVELNTRLFKRCREVCVFPG